METTFEREASGAKFRIHHNVGEEDPFFSALATADKAALIVGEKQEEVKCSPLLENGKLLVKALFKGVKGEVHAVGLKAGEDLLFQHRIDPPHLVTGDYALTVDLFEVEEEKPSTGGSAGAKAKVEIV